MLADKDATQHIERRCLASLCLADSGVSTSECNYIMLADKDATQHSERRCLASLCLADNGVSTLECKYADCVGSQYLLVGI